MAICNELFPKAIDYFTGHAEDSFDMDNNSKDDDDDINEEEIDLEWTHPSTRPKCKLQVTF